MELSSRASARRRRLLYFVMPGGLFDHRPPVLRLRRQNLADAALLDDGVAFRAQAGAHKDVLDVAQPGLAAVDQVFALAGAEQAARDGDFARLRRAAAISWTLGAASRLCPRGGFRRRAAALRSWASGSDQNHGHRRHSDRFAGLGAREDHVFHAGAAQAAGGLLAQHPADGVAQVRFAAPVRTHHCCDPAAVETQFRLVAEGLKALKFDFPQLEHACTS